MCQWREAIQTNKKEEKIMIVYEGMKRAPKLGKVYFPA